MVNLFRELGLDVETAVALEQELNRLPERTRQVFLLRAQGYTQEETGQRTGVSARSVRKHLEKCRKVPFVVRFCPKIRTYIGEGEIISDYT